MKDLREFHDPHLTLPIGGKEYVIPCPNAADGLRLQTVFNDPSASFTDGDEIAEIAKLFGAVWEPKPTTVHAVDDTTGIPLIDDGGEPVTVEVDRGAYAGGVWSQMVSDGVSWRELMHAGRTAMFHYAISGEYAELFWATGLINRASGNPMPPRPDWVTGANRKTRRRKNRRRSKTQKPATGTTHGPVPTETMIPAEDHTTP